MLALALLAVCCGGIVAATAGALDSAQTTVSPRQAPTPGSSGLHVVRELPELRTATSDTFLQSDGTRKTKIYARPVNYRGAAGKWAPIESRLVRAGDGTWHPGASAVALSLPASLASGPVAVGSGDRRLAFALQSAGSSAGSAVGAQETYANALPHVEAAYASMPEGVRETLTLDSAEAPSAYRYKLSLGAGLHARVARGGAVAVLDSAGKHVYTIAAPTVLDSAPGAHLPTPGVAHYELSSDGTTLTLALSQKWLSEPGRVFPVKVDPDVFYSEQEDCSVISQAYANWSPCGGELYVGADSASPKNVSRALLRFDLSSIPANSDILRSRLALWFYEDTNSEPLEIEAHALTRAFTQEATWNSYNGSSGWTTAGGDFSGELAGETTLLDGWKEYWVNWGFTPTVEKWVHEPSTNDGILLKAKNEAKSGYDTFFQAENGWEAPEPNMEVEYEARLGDDGGSDRLLVTTELGNGAEAGVNVSNGNLQIANPDVHYNEGEYETVLNRYYNGYDSELTTSSLGDGWRLSTGQDTLLYPTWWDGSYVFHEPGGMYLRFDRDPADDGSPASGDLAYHVPTSVNQTLVVHGDGSRTVTNNETGEEVQFDKSENGFPQEIVNAQGEGDTLSLSYSSSRLSKVTDTHGHELTLAHDPSTHYVTKISGAGSESWEYGYNSSHLLTSYKGPEGQKAEYSYGSYGLVTKIVDPSGTYVISYNSEYRVASIRKLVNGTVTTPGSEDETTAFSYEAPTSPACEAGTNAGQTVVSYTPGEESSETYCYNTAGEETGYAATGEEEEEAEPEFEAQPEVPECYPNEGYCGTEELPSASEEEEEEGFHALLAGPSIPDLKPGQYGISDNNKVLEGTHFEYFANKPFKELNVKKVRRVVPWNIVAAGGEELADVKKWVTKVEALHGSEGEPIISFEYCNECSPPSEASYKKGMEEFLGDPTLGKVKYFTAWNEPNNVGAPTFVSATLAGNYWRILDELCKASCRVGAGDFSDTKMHNAENAKGAGGEYFKKYVAAMKYAPKARQWAWHSYSDGVAVVTKLAGKKASEWWPSFKKYLGAVSGKSKVNFDIWLTEQGVVYTNHGKRQPGAVKDNAMRIMKAYVQHGEDQLTRQSKHIKMFNYYEMRGEAKATTHQDSGLINPANQVRGIFGVYRAKTHP